MRHRWLRSDGGATPGRCWQSRSTIAGTARTGVARALLTKWPARRRAPWVPTQDGSRFQASIATRSFLGIRPGPDRSRQQDAEGVDALAQHDSLCRICPGPGCCLRGGLRLPTYRSSGSHSAKGDCRPGANAFPRTILSVIIGLAGHHGIIWHYVSLCVIM